MKIGDMIESKYLKQSDVDEEMTVTIAGLKKVNVARDDEDLEYRWTVKFDEFPKPMVLNVTNLKRLAKACGDDTDDWMGKSVILYVDPDIEFGGNVVHQGARFGGEESRGALMVHAAVGDETSIPHGTGHRDPLSTSKRTACPALSVL